jgi:methylaspartate mutase sigma subunit
VFGVIGDDIHVVANRILAIGLEAAGYEAFNLGTHNTVEDFVAAALETEADAVLVSSLNGEGETWCVDFRDRFAKIGRAEIVLYAGGNLVIGDREAKEVVELFTSWGFDRVFYRTANFDEMFALLSRDLQASRSARSARNGTVLIGNEAAND